MPARDIFHNAVRVALEKDAWTITDDPLSLELEEFPFQIEPETEGMLAAEKAGRKIALEIKSFPGASRIDDFYGYLGQFVFYHEVLKEKQPDRILYLAFTREVYDDFFTKQFIQEVLEKHEVKQLIVDINEESIWSWKE